MSSIFAWQVEAKDSPAQWVQKAPLPLTEDQVRIRIEASSLNYKDALAVTGKGRIMRRFPCVAGIDLAGEVIESSSPQWSVGASVLATGCFLGEQVDGGLATEVVMAAENVIARPPEVSSVQAMAWGTAGFTAALAVQRMLDNGQRPDMGPIAVTGATGGVGSIAIALLAKLGFAPVAVTRRGADHADYLKQLGAVDIHAADVDEQAPPLQKTHWGGVIDNVGGALLAQLIAQTNLWGNVASIGLAGSAKLPATVLPFILRGVNLLGVHSVEWPMAPRRQIWEKIFGDWQLDHSLWLRHQVPLAEIMPVCEAMLAGTHDGRAAVLCTAHAT